MRQKRGEQAGRSVFRQFGVRSCWRRQSKGESSIRPKQFRRFPGDAKKCGWSHDVDEK